MIELSGVGHVYSPRSPWEHRALIGIDLVVRERERILIVGANGSGKSTLAWIMAGLTEPSEGTARINGVPISSTRGVVVIAFQHARLQLFRPTVGEDIAYGTRATIDEVAHAQRLVGLDPARFATRRIDELSGGEQRRVAIAGLLVRRPKLLILDEPFAGLDPPARELLHDVLETLPARTGCATVVVSHDTEDAGRISDRILELRDGRIVSTEGVR
jgi:energy-coupling factor transport system ATP-binding protein